MRLYPCAKINIGLNVVSRRSDGYHNLQTVFYPIALCDVLETEPSSALTLTVTGDDVDCPMEKNLVVKAYCMLYKDFDLPPVSIRLHKRIPSQAGLGGGSSDATAMLLALNEMFAVGLSDKELAAYAARLGADCPFFVQAKPCYATGIGELLSPIDVGKRLRGKHIVIVKPPVAVSTREAFGGISLSDAPRTSPAEIVGEPVERWRDKLSNDFETTVFRIHPELAEIKKRLYDVGAIYAQMSGSGSAIYGIFPSSPDIGQETFPDSRLFILPL